MNLLKFMHAVDRENFNSTEVRQQIVFENPFEIAAIAYEELMTNYRVPFIQLVVEHSCDEYSFSIGGDRIVADTKELFEDYFEDLASQDNFDDLLTTLSRYEIRYFQIRKNSILLNLE